MNRFLGMSGKILVTFLMILIVKFRVKPGYSITLQELERDLKTIVIKSDILPDFYAIPNPNEFRLVDSTLYKNGIIYGLDLASGITVRELNIQPDEHVLELW